MDRRIRSRDRDLIPAAVAFFVAVVGVVGLLVIERVPRDEIRHGDFGDITGSVAARVGATVRPTDPGQNVFP